MQPKAVIVSVLLILHLLLFWKIDLFNFMLGRVQLWDFDVYHQTAIDVRNGMHPYQLPYMQTAGPPLVIAPFIPFSFLPLPVARGAMIFISIAATFSTCWLLSKQLFHRQPLVFALVLNLLILLSFQPRFNFILGQPNLIIMLLITILLTLKKGKYSGALVALSTVLKTHYLLAWLAYLKKSKKQFFSAALVLILIMIIAIPVIKPQFYVDYFSNRFSEYVTDHAIISDVNYYNQSLRATTARLGIPELTMMLSVLILVFGGWFVYSSRDEASGFLLALLISPVVWQHYMVITYPIIFLTAVAFAKMRKLPWHLVAAAMLLFGHLPWLHGKLVTLPLGVVASHYYVGVLVLLYSRYRLLLKSKL